jgi:hypothetical protein
MAQVNHCEVCDSLVINKKCCNECESTKSDDLLAKLKICMETGTFIPADVHKAVIDGNWKTLPEYLALKKKTEELRKEKEMWISRRAEAFQQFIQEWQKEHPDPDPPTC